MIVRKVQRGARRLIEKTDDIYVCFCQGSSESAKGRVLVIVLEKLVMVFEMLASMSAVNVL